MKIHQYLIMHYMSMHGDYNKTIFIFFFINLVRFEMTCSCNYFSQFFNMS